MDFEILPPHHHDTPQCDALPNKAAIGGQLYVPLEFAQHLEREHNATRNILRDPGAVYINLLRGTIARPEVDAIMHIYGKHPDHVKAEEQVLKLRQVLELIAAPERPDGTYNRDRKACEVLAKEALS